MASGTSGEREKRDMTARYSATARPCLNSWAKDCPTCNWAWDARGSLGKRWMKERKKRRASSRMPPASRFCDSFQSASLSSGMVGATRSMIFCCSCAVFCWVCSNAASRFCSSSTRCLASSSFPASAAMSLSLCATLVPRSAEFRSSKPVASSSNLRRRAIWSLVLVSMASIRLESREMSSRSLSPWSVVIRQPENTTTASVQPAVR